LRISGPRPKLDRISLTEDTVPKFSAQSLAQLETAHPSLQTLFQRVVLQFDCKILQGVRTLEEQAENVRKGVSKTMNSKHLRQSDGYAHAVDVVPWHPEAPHIRWDDRERFMLFGGYVRGIAELLGISVRWGGAWKGGWRETPQSFDDLPHWELT